jgi:ribulose-5-phosphate 4-epimerase/fuculose-1-phosphate aldolase
MGVFFSLRRANSAGRQQAVEGCTCTRSPPSPRDAAGLAVCVPVVPNSQDMTILSDCVERSRDPRVPAVIVADHGLYAWGSDILQARHHTEAVGWLLELALATR